MIIRNFKSPILSEFCIVDNEISNDIVEKMKPPKRDIWHYDWAEISCFGILFGDTIKIILREKDDDEDIFKNKIIEELDKHKSVYAFNKDMEFNNYKGYLGKVYDVKEIQAFHGRGKNKQFFIKELIDDSIINKSDIPLDPIEDDSKKCIELYQKEDYETIINHNLVDLVKQAILLKHKDYLFEKYKDKIDENGWFIA